MKPAKDVFLFIPHTHWEGAVFKTREEYLDLGLPIILRALRLLEKHPHYRFVLDQACFVQPFLERYPEAAATLRGHVEAGRVEIAGGMDVMPDVNMPGGESCVRQILYGKGFFRRVLGVDVRIGWQLDTFGHHAQMPQLMRLAGYRSFWSQRGVPDLNLPSEFLWEGLDGTRIPFYWLPQSYAVTFKSPSTLPEFTAFMIQRYEALTPNSAGAGRVGPAGADVCLPEEHVPELVGPFNEQPDMPFELRIGLPSDYERLVEARGDERPVVRGELNPIFQGTYSSRIELKQRSRELERLLTSAEKLDALLHALGEPVNDGDLWPAWEPMLFNQTHDLMSGVMTDHVFVDVIGGFDYAARSAQAAVESRLARLAPCIDTRGDGVPLVVHNTMSWSRTDVAYADAGFTGDDVRDLRLVDADGRPVPFQIYHADRSDRGALIRVKIAFVARDVPAMGHAVYHLTPLSCDPEPAPAPETETGIDGLLENEHYRLHIDPATGAITRLVAKAGDWEVLNGPGNVVAREDDRGDLWEPYRHLNAGQFVTMKERHPAPAPGQAVLSTDVQGTDGTLTRGPVFSELSVSHPFGEGGHFHTRVRLFHGVRRIEVRTQVRNDERYVRYRGLFPTPFAAGPSTHEIPYGAIERPDGIEYPAQNWFAHGDGEHGVAILNRGLPGSNVADGVMMVSLMRSADIAAYGIGGGYEGQASASGFEVGKQNTFDYALVAYDGDWRAAGITREGLAYNHPFLVRSAAPRAGALPGRWGLLEISHRHVVASALKWSEDGQGAVLRVYETAGEAVEARIQLHVDVDAAYEVDLMEDTIREAPVEGNGLMLQLRPFEIKSFRIRFAAAG